MRKSLFLGLIIILIVGCNRYPANYQPKDLEDALTYLDYTWDKANKEKFKMTPEDSAVAMMPFEVGMQIRNNWNLWSGDNPLSKYFQSIGIFHPDDMSSIILTSFHRRLNNKDIDLDGQVSFYKNYWSKIEKIEAKRKQQTIKIYNQYNKEENIIVCMYVDTINQVIRAVGVPGNDWTVDPYKDLLLKCSIIDKFVNIDSDYCFKVKIKDMNRIGIPTMYGVLKVGDIVDIKIAYSQIKQ